MKLIPLGGKLGIGKFAMVDDDDYERLNTMRWHLAPDGYVMTTETAWGRLMHRIIRGYLPREPERVDHINGNKLDNRGQNLRQATAAQNAQNRRVSPGKSSQYRGVSFHKKTKMWRAEVRKEGKYYFGGRFKREVDAAIVARELRLMLFPFTIEPPITDN